MVGEVELYYKELAKKERSKTKVGNMIRESRKEKGISVTELAKDLHVNRSAVQHWEHGRRVPSAFNALQLSIKLEIPLENLCSRSNRELMEVRPNCPNLTKILMV